MKPLSTTIKGFGPFVEEFTVNWDDSGAVVAILGPNGAGKTTLLESDLMCLYGISIARGSVYGALSQGGTEGRLVCVFEAGGIRYECERIVKFAEKSQSQKAWLRLHPSGELLAGPKSTDVKEKVEALLGDDRVALATWFAAQGGAGDLCSVAPAERRAVFGKLLDHEGLQRMSDKFRNLAAGCEAHAGLLESQCAGAVDFDAEIGGRVINLQGLRTELVLLTERLTKATADHTRALADLTAADSDTGQLKAAVERHEQATERAREIETRREQIEQEIFGLLQKVNAIGTLEGEVRALETQQGERALLNQQKAAFDAYRNWNTAGSPLHSDVDRLTSDVKALRERAALNDMATLEKNVATLRERMAERDRLNGQKVKFDAHHAWDKKRAELKGEVGRIAGLIEVLKARPGLDDATRTLAGRLSELRGKYDAALKENKRREQSNSHNQLRRQQAEFGIESVKGIIARLEKQIEARPKTPAEESVCNTCPLMKDWADIPNQVETAKKKLAEYESTLATTPADETVEDLTDLINKGRDAKNAAETVLGTELAAAELAQREAEHEAARAALETHLPTEPERADDPSDELKKCQTGIDELSGAPEKLTAARQIETDVATREAERKAAVEKLQAHLLLEPDKADDPAEQIDACQKEIDRLSGAPDRLNAAREAETTLATRRTELERLETDLEAARARVTELAPDAETARRTLEDKDRTTAELRERIHELANQIQSMKGEERTLNQGITRNETEIAGLEKQKLELAEKQAEAKSMRARTDRLRKLQAAFGPRGVQAILIDRAVPQLENLMAGMLDQLLGGRIQVRLATQAVNRDGSIREDFLILARDASGERDVCTYSGGEQRIIRTVLRLAVAQWIGQLHGRRADSIRIDEGFDALDGDNQAAMVDLLTGLGNQYERVLIITHDPEIASRLPRNIRLEKRWGGVCLEGVGA